MAMIATIGIDLAKSVFSIHAVSDRGVVQMHCTVSRAKLVPLVPLVAKLPPCLIGMEACSGSHDQQAVLTLHRIRRGFVTERTAIINRMRSLLAEFEIVVAQASDSGQPERNHSVTQRATAKATAAGLTKVRSRTYASDIALK